MHEAAGAPVDLTVFPAQAVTLLSEAENNARNRGRSGSYHDVDIRFIREARFLHDVSTNKDIGEIDGNVIHRETHYGAVYRHGGTRYRVTGRQKPATRSAKGKILLKPEPDEDVYTTPSVDVDIAITDLETIVAKRGFAIVASAGERGIWSLALSVSWS